MNDSQPAYRVLARKYRPQTFAQLLGQDAMVQTLANAIKRGRIAHAFLMTGVRGVGKTSTARLIAKALNCIGPDGAGGPTIDPCGLCEPCRAIAEGRHIDIIEMDAASHTSIDDVREIIEAVRYSAVSARFKMYIIDEAHMLSKAAWNGLLKTLEEPPEHVKFLFATTEVNKVPVTVLSRCQRFDLRRISADTLSAHFAHVIAQEAVEAEPAALAMIAHAAEGSARDGLSILDQAIAHADTGAEGRPMVRADQVRSMLGLADRGMVRALFAHILAGDAGVMLDAVRGQYQLGVEPLAMLRGLLDTVHAVTAAKAGRAAPDPSQSHEEAEATAEWASRIGFAPLHRLWQLLLRGYEEVAGAILPMEAAEMALLRVMHAASLPDPSDLARMLREGAHGSPPVAGGTGGGGTDTPPMPADFAAMIALVDTASPRLANDLHDCAGLVRYAPPELDLRLRAPLRAEFLAELADVLRTLTGVRWTVSQSGEAGEPTLREQEQAREAAARDAIMAMPVVSAAFAAFPDAELIKPETDEQWSASA